MAPPASLTCFWLARLNISHKGGTGVIIRRAICNVAGRGSALPLISRILLTKRNIFRIISLIVNNINMLIKILVGSPAKPNEAAGRNRAIALRNHLWRVHPNVRSLTQDSLENLSDRLIADSSTEERA